MISSSESNLRRAKIYKLSWYSQQRKKPKKLTNSNRLINTCNLHDGSEFTLVMAQSMRASRLY